MSAKSAPVCVTSPKKEELTFREHTAQLKLRRIQLAFLYFNIKMRALLSRD